MDNFSQALARAETNTQDTHTSAPSNWLERTVNDIYEYGKTHPLTSLAAAAGITAGTVGLLYLTRGRAAAVEEAAGGFLSGAASKAESAGSTLAKESELLTTGLRQAHAVPIDLPCFASRTESVAAPLARESEFLTTGLRQTHAVPMDFLRPEMDPSLLEAIRATKNSRVASGNAFESASLLADKLGFAEPPMVTRTYNWIPPRGLAGEIRTAHPPAGTPDYRWVQGRGLAIEIRTAQPPAGTPDYRWVQGRGLAIEIRTAHPPA